MMRCLWRCPLVSGLPAGADWSGSVLKTAKQVSWSSTATER